MRREPRRRRPRRARARERSAWLGLVRGCAGGCAGGCARGCVRRRRLCLWRGNGRLLVPVLYGLPVIRGVEPAPLEDQADRREHFAGRTAALRALWRGLAHGLMTLEDVLTLRTAVFVDRHGRSSDLPKELPPIIRSWREGVNPGCY